MAPRYFFLDNKCNFYFSRCHQDGTNGCIMFYASIILHSLACQMHYSWVQIYWTQIFQIIAISNTKIIPLKILCKSTGKLRCILNCNFTVHLIYWTVCHTPANSTSPDGTLQSLSEPAVKQCDKVNVRCTWGWPSIFFTCFLCHIVVMWWSQLN